LAAKIALQINITRSQGYYCANIPEFGISDYGKTKKELMKNLQNALSLALEEMVEANDLNKRKRVSEIVSETIKDKKVPDNDVKGFGKLVSNILLSSSSYAKHIA
jgi:predicted RNase H-like HicB family nuclease